MKRQVFIHMDKIKSGIMRELQHAKRYSITSGGCGGQFWKKVVALEAELNANITAEHLKTNQARKLIIELPNEWQSCHPDILKDYGRIISRELLGKDIYHSFFISPGKQNDNLHLTIFFYERIHGSVYAKYANDKYIHPETKRFCSKETPGAIHVIKKGQPKRDDSGKRIKFEQLFGIKLDKFKDRSWLRNAKMQMLKIFEMLDCYLYIQKANVLAQLRYKSIRDDKQKLITKAISIQITLFHQLSQNLLQSLRGKKQRKTRSKLKEYIMVIRNCDGLEKYRYLFNINNKIQRLIHE